MSYNTFNIITSINDSEDYIKLQSDIKSLFPLANIRQVVHPFKGIVGQLAVERGSKVVFEEVFQSHSVTISKLNPGKKIAFIEVDCFGGKCSSEGKVLHNGEAILNEENDHIAHVRILKVIDDNYKTWHFEPFTREYFIKKGGIWGQINDEKLVFFGLGIAVAYKDNPEFRFDMTPNELILEKTGKFSLYLMEPLEKTIKILGSLYDDADETIEELTKIINEHILYAKSYVFIELIDKDKLISFNNWGEDDFQESLYRFQPFNDRPFSTTNNTIPSTSSKRKNRTNEQEEEDDNESPKSFWETIKWLFGK